MLDERMGHVGSEYINQSPMQKALREAEIMHGRSIDILSQHLNLSPSEVENKLETYLTEGTGFDKSDETTARMINMARKTLESLRTNQKRSQTNH